MGKNSEKQQNEEKNSDTNEIPTSESKNIFISKPEDNFKKDLPGKDDSCWPRKSTRVGLKMEAIVEKNNLQQKPNDEMESEPSTCCEAEKMNPTKKMAKKECLTEQQNKEGKTSLDMDALSLGCNDSSKLNLVLSLKQDDASKLKDPHTLKKDLPTREQLTQECCSSVPSAASPVVLSAGVQYFQEDFKQNRKLWEAFVATCSPLAVTDPRTLSDTSEPESLQEIATMEQILSTQPPPEGEASQDSVFSRPELEQEGKQSSSSRQESPVVSSLPKLPPPDVPTPYVRGRKSVSKKVYTSLAKHKLQHAQGGRDTHLKPIHREQQAQVPHTVPRPPLAVNLEVKTQLVAQPLQPQLVQFPWLLQSSSGVASTTPRFTLLPRAWYGFHPFSIPHHFLIPALIPLELPEEFHVKETHGGRKGADKPPDQNTSGTSTGSGGMGQTPEGGGQGSEEGASGGGGGMSSSGAGGDDKRDPPEQSDPTTSNDEDEEEEEEREDEEESSEKTQEDSGYKSSEKGDSSKWSSSQSSQQASDETLNRTEQGALVVQETSGAGVYSATITEHYPEFYETDLWGFHASMSPSHQIFRQNVSPPTSPLHTPPSTSLPPSPSSSLVLPSLPPLHSPPFSFPPTQHPTFMQETQHPMGQSAQLVLPATGQDQPLPHHTEDGEESDVEPGPVPFQDGPMPSQNYPIPFLAPGGGQSSLARGLESRSKHESDSSSEQSRDSA